MATKAEIDNLKSQWEADPCWDLEETEGFEEHRHELLKHRLDMEDKWDKQEETELRSLAKVIGIDNNLKLALHIRDMSRRITALEEKLNIH